MYLPFPNLLGSGTGDLALLKVLDDLDSLRGSSVNIGTMQRRLAWPLRKDDTHNDQDDVNHVGTDPPTARHINIYM